MICVEDREFAAFSLKEGEVAVPVQIRHLLEEEEPQILVYEAFLSVAEEFESLYGKHPFAQEAIAFLKDKLMPVMSDFGFLLPKDYDKRIRLFRLADVQGINEGAILPTTRLLSGKDDIGLYENLTTHDLVMDREDPDDVTAAVIENGSILAYATVNDISEIEGELEISVECALPYRGKGYATACVALLAKTLIERGYAVAYKCRHTNIASGKVAERAGFTEIGMEYNFVWYRNLSENG